MIQSFYRLANALADRAGSRSGSPAAPAQGHGDGLMTLALVNGRVLADDGFVERPRRAARSASGSSTSSPLAIRACARAERYDLRGHILLPGFIDAQVNGGGGVLFNDEPTVDAIRAIGRAHRRFGTTGFLPTLISDDLHVVAPRDRGRAGRASRRTCRACSASTSKARISTSSAAASTTPRSCASSTRVRSDC